VFPTGDHGRHYFWLKAAAGDECEQIGQVGTVGHESGKGTKQRDPIAVTTGRNQGPDQGLAWARKSRFETLLPFNAAFF